MEASHGGEPVMPSNHNEMTPPLVMPAEPSRVDSYLSRSNSGGSSHDFLRREHAAAEAPYDPPNNCAQWILCLCANEWFCCAGRCEAPDPMSRNGFCVPCSAPICPGCSDPICCLLTLVSPCCGILRGGNWKACALDTAQCMLVDAEETNYAEETNAGGCVWCCIWISTAIPVFGYLSAPCVLAGMYHRYGLRDKIRPEWCRAMMNPCFFAMGPIPCGFGLPCCCFPCTAAQIWRDENPSVDNCVPSSALQYVESRKAKWSGSSCPSTLNISLIRETRHAGVSRPEKVKVQAWNTLAEVLHANPTSWWATCADSPEQLPRNGWVTDLVGSKDSKICAILEDASQDSTVWVNDFVVTSTSEMGELWCEAIRCSKKNEELFGDLTMLVNVHWDETGVEEEILLKATDLVGSLDSTKQVVFCGDPIACNQPWGQAWQSSGMNANCMINLRELQLCRQQQLVLAAKPNPLYVPRAFII